MSCPHENEECFIPRDCAICCYYYENLNEDSLDYEDPADYYEEFIIEREKNKNDNLASRRRKE